MSKKVSKLYKFKSEELNELIKSKTSLIKLVKTVEHVNINPCDLKDLTQAVDKTLDTKVGKYDKKLGGLLLSYNKLRLLPGSGTIVNDSPIIHLSIEGNFYVFSPQVGSVLLADVNKVSEDHVGCLVHKIFNVSIPRSKKDEDDEDWIGNKLKLGQKIYVKITYMDLFYTIPYIKAEIDPRTEEIREEIIVTTEEKKSKSKNKHQTGLVSTSLDVKVDKVKPVKKKNKSKKGKSETDNTEESIDDVDEIRKNLLLNALAETSLDETLKLDKSIDIENGKSEKKSKKRKSKDTLNIETVDIDRIKQTLLANAVAIAESSLDETDKENSKKSKNSETKTPKKKSRKSDEIDIHELTTPVQSKQVIDELPNVSTFGTPDFTSTVRSKKSKKSKREELGTPARSEDVEQLTDSSTLGTPDFNLTVKSKKSKKKTRTLDDTSTELLKSPKNKSKKLRLDSELDMGELSTVTQEKTPSKKRKPKEDKNGESHKKPKTQSLKDFQLELLQKYLKPESNI